MSNRQAGVGQQQSESSMHVSLGVWQKYVGSVQKRSSCPPGEQYPAGPQSESLLQLLPVAQTLGELSSALGRQSHGTPLGQSESDSHWSYEHSGGGQGGGGGMNGTAKQRPFTPAVQSPS